MFLPTLRYMRGFTMLKEFLTQRAVIVGAIFYAWVFWVLWRHLYKEARDPKGDRGMLVNLMRKFCDWRKMSMRKEYFFYQNSIIRRCVLLLFLALVVVIPLMSFILKMGLDMGRFNTDNTNSEFTKFFIDNFFLVTFSIAASFFVSYIFYSLTTLEDKKQKDINALNVLRAIARCHIISTHIKKYSKERSKCLPIHGGILNYESALCSHFMHFNNPDNICIWGCFSGKELYKCTSHSELTRLSYYMRQQLNIGYSVASTSKPSLISILNIVNNSVQAFERMVNSSKLIDIDVLNSIDMCHNFFCENLSSDKSKLKNITIYRDMWRVKIEYKDIYAEEEVPTKFSLLPLMKNVVLKKLSGG